MTAEKADEKKPEKPEKAEAAPFPDVVVELFPGDETLTPGALRALSMFRRDPPDENLDAWLKKVEDWLEDRPGALVLRRYSAEELVCEEGEPGWTAFYILRTDELIAIRKLQLAEAEKKLATVTGALERASMQASIEQWRRSASALEARAGELQKSVASVAAIAPDLARKGPGDWWAIAQQDERNARAGSSAGTRKLGSERAAVLRAAAEPWIVASISISTPEAPGARKRGFVARLLGLGAPAAPEPGTIAIDGPADLDRAAPRGVMFEGELFGEMSCRFRTPRSASVLATREVYMLELLPHVFEKLLDDLPKKGAKPSERDPSPLKAHLDAVYKERTLATQLRNHPVFRDLPPEVYAAFARELKPGVDFPEFEAGQTILKKGDPPDALYVIRVGTVRVESEGLVLAYKGRGELLGEMGVIEGRPRNATCIAYAHPTQTRGKARISLVRIPRELFDRVLRKHVSSKIEALIAKTRAEREAQRGRALDIRGPLEELGLPQGEKLMLIDLDRCTRCDECVKACAATHEDGRSRLFREGPVFENYLVPASCRQCRDPVCTIGCPVAAIHKSEKGSITIESWCVGCELCANSCPYGSIVMHERRKDEQPPPNTRVLKPLIANVCDQCTTLAGGKPSCVYACPHGAALRVDALDFIAKRQRALAPAAPRSPT